jgi:mannose-1-phosphate guanylyltransferase
MQRPKAVLLVGGLGTRLRPLTNDRPKSIVPVLNRPVLEHTLAYLKQYGITDIIITLNYLPEVIEEYFGDGSRFGVNLAYFMEVEPRGTAGAVKNAESYLDRSFFVLNGDIFTDLNLNEMYAFHRKRKAQATIALSYVKDPSAFGVVQMEADGLVKKFIEKPPSGTAPSNWINAGTYILEPDVLADIPPGVHHMFERGLFPHLLNTGKPVYGYPYKGYWLDMGTPAQYYKINIDFLNAQISNALVGKTGLKPIYNKKAVNIHPTALVTGPVMLGDGCDIGPGVKVVGPAVIGKNCRLNDGAVIDNSILWDGVAVGENSHVVRCIISSGTVIPAGQEIVNSIVTPAESLVLDLPDNTVSKNNPVSKKE